MNFVSSMGRTHGVSNVKIIHLEGTAEESSIDAQAMIQSESGFFDVTTPIYEGDVVEVPDPRTGGSGTERRLAKTVKVNNFGPPHMRHIHVEWGTSPTPRAAPVRRLTFENLHGEVQAAAGALFADGHYELSVSEAFKSIEIRVRNLTGVKKSGAGLMGDAFKMDGSVLDVAEHEGRSGEDEREGFLHIFRGSMLGIRNPGAHELFQSGDPQQALEYLGFASLLHRRIDAAEQKLEAR